MTRRRRYLLLSLIVCMCTVAIGLERGLPPGKAMATSAGEAGNAVSQLRGDTTSPAGPTLVSADEAGGLGTVTRRIFLPGVARQVASPSAPGALPPVPAGIPGHFTFGLANAVVTDLPSGIAYDFRYQYLCAGVNTGEGWAQWNTNGSFATNYIRDSRARGLIPVFIYYQILQSAPSYDEYANLQNAGTMRAYFDDFKLLMQKARAEGGKIFVDVEPDLTGVMQQHASNTADDASRQPTAVSSSGHPDVQGYPNTLAGFYRALAHLRDVYAPEVSLGVDVSAWGASDDITLIRSASYDWQNHARRTAKYLNSLAAGYQLLFFDPLDRDAAYYQLTQNSNRWWDDTNTTLPNFNRMAEWMGLIMSQMNMRALMWQVPVGNRVYRTMNNTTGHWQDNRAEYFLNPTTGRQHIQQWMSYGFLGMMFGAGASGQTHPNDAQGDGTTNPAAINGNNAWSSYPDDDGGYLRVRIGAYYAEGAMPLP